MTSPTETSPSPPAPDQQNLRGVVSNKTLGETDVLHLRVHYGYKLNIPIANLIIIKALQGYQVLVRSYYDVMSTDGGASPAQDYAISSLDSHYLKDGRIPLAADGVVGMESPVFWHPFFSFGPQNIGNATFDWATGTAAAVSPEDHPIVNPSVVATEVQSYMRSLGVGLLAAAGAVEGVVGDKIGTRNAFCPALWGPSGRGALSGIKNPMDSSGS